MLRLTRYIGHHPLIVLLLAGVLIGPLMVAMLWAVAYVTKLVNPKELLSTVLQSSE